MTRRVGHRTPSGPASPPSRHGPQLAGFRDMSTSSAVCLATPSLTIRAGPPMLASEPRPRLSPPYAVPAPRRLGACSRSGRAEPETADALRSRKPVADSFPSGNAAGRGWARNQSMVCRVVLQKQWEGPRDDDTDERLAPSERSGRGGNPFVSRESKTGRAPEAGSPPCVSPSHLESR